MFYHFQEDLVGLKVTNTLHHLSIKSGIQVLRQNNFSPSCLKRRPAPDEVRAHTHVRTHNHCGIRVLICAAAVTEKSSDVDVYVFTVSLASVWDGSQSSSFFSQHGPLQNIPGEVLLWTNHRVMEWLRTIDLSEYAPNLRGSGVHGALMVGAAAGIVEARASVCRLSRSEISPRNLRVHREPGS